MNPTRTRTLMHSVVVSGARAASSLLMVAALVVPLGASAQTPAPQVIMHGQVTRAESLTGTSPARSLYVFWEASEGRLEDLLPDGATLQLVRDGEIVLGPFPKGELASIDQIQRRYASPTEARRLAETMAILDKAFEREQGQSLPALPDLPPDVQPTLATFPQVLHQVLSDARWDPVTQMLARLDPNVAFAARRAWIEPAPSADTTFSLQLLVGTNPPIELGRVQIDVDEDFVVGPPSRFEAVTEDLFRCDGPDWSRAQGTVALTWDHPGLADVRSVGASLVASIPIAGYDLFARPGSCDGVTDLAEAARLSAFGPRGAVVPSGWRKVNEQLILIQSPAPVRAPDTSAEYVSTWQPRFAQTLELVSTLGPLGLEPGDEVCYGLVARDRTGNYGHGSYLGTRVGDFQPPESPWNVSAVTRSEMSYVPAGGLVDDKALYIEWPHVDVDNWLWSHASYYTPCNIEAARTTRAGRLDIAPTPDACNDPKRRASIRLDVTEYLVYRFASAHEANAFSDADGDGFPDADERRVDVNGDRVADIPESSVNPDYLGSLPASDPADACSPHPSATGPVLADVIEASDAVVGADGRPMLRFTDTAPIQNRGEVFWYRVAARSSDGRLSRLSPPVRAAFYDMEKPAPFDLGPGGDAGFFACEPKTFQDDFPPDMSPDDPEFSDWAFQPLGVQLDPLEDGGRFRPRRVFGVDPTGKAAQLRITCVDEALNKRAEDSQDPDLLRAAIRMRMDSFVGAIDDGGRLTGALYLQLTEQALWPDSLVKNRARLLWADQALTEQVCGALTAKAYSFLFQFNPDGPAQGQLVQSCTPHVEFLDAEGRSLAPPAPIEIRDDGSINAFDGRFCRDNPLMPGCETFACNFVAALHPEVCDRRIDDEVGLVTGPVKVRTTVARGECAYVEASQEFPVHDALGRITGFEVQPYRLGWECCKDTTCQIEQTLEPGNFGAEQSCYSVTRVNNTAAGAGNTLAATRTGGPCIKRALPAGQAKAPPPPRLVELTADPTRLSQLTPPCVDTCPCPAGQVQVEGGTCVALDHTMALAWTSPEVPTAGAIIEFWKEGGAPTERGTRFIPTRGRYGLQNPKTDFVDLATPPPTQLERWCLTARSVGISAPDKPEEQVSAATAPICIERRPPGVALPQYLPWPELPRATKLGSLNVEYLAGDGFPFVSVANLEGLEFAPEVTWDVDGDDGYDPAIPWDDDKGCADMDQCGCRPAVPCNTSSPEQVCLARPHLDPGSSDLDTSTYFWPPTHSEVHSRCAGFCSRLQSNNTFTNVVVYRRSRPTGQPGELGPFVQVSELITSPFCNFSRQQFRQWRPLVSRFRSPVRFGTDDPNFAVLDLQREGAFDRTMELVWLDRHPHVEGHDYQYQFVFFDERGEIRGYKDSNWIVYQSVPPHALWTPEAQP